MLKVLELKKINCRSWGFKPTTDQLQWYLHLQLSTPVFPVRYGRQTVRSTPTTHQSELRKLDSHSQVSPPEEGLHKK